MHTSTGRGGFASKLQTVASLFHGIRSFVRAPRGPAGITPVGPTPRPNAGKKNANLLANFEENNGAKHSDFRQLSAIL